MKSIYQLGIILNDIEPAVTRKVLVESDIDLHRLHLVIQYAMGWENSHLYFFENKENKYEIRDEVYDKATNYDFGVYKVKLKEDKNNWDELFATMPHMAKHVKVPKKDMDCREKLVAEVFVKPGDALKYVYDFGDDWQHTITLEKILEPEAGKFYPLCSEGTGACPPEDCGGIPGYMLFLEAIKDKKHPNHKEMIEWFDGVFDPNAFDLKAANATIKKLFSSKAALQFKA